MPTYFPGKKVPSSGMVKPTNYMKFLMRWDGSWGNDFETLADVVTQMVAGLFAQPSYSSFKGGNVGRTTLELIML